MQMSRFKMFFAAALLVAFAITAAAQEAERPFLSPIFGSHMVIQRDMKVPVWGWTRPGRHVAVRMGEKTVSAWGDNNGKWMVRIGPFKAGGPYQMRVSGLSEIVLDDVLVGDVWVAAGQSNMEWPVMISDNPEQEIAQANHPQIRLFTVGKKVALEPQESLDGQWQPCTPQTVGGFSAVAYFFGRHLQQELGVPIGLINTSWGGTPAESWTSAPALRAMPDYRPAIQQLEEILADRGNLTVSYEQQVAAWWDRNDPGSGAGWQDPDADTSVWKPITLPATIEASGLPDFDGVFWLREDLDLPEAATGREAALNLGPIDDRDTAWVNGVKVGETGQYNAPRQYKIPAGILKAGRNVIAVRVLDTGGTGGLTGTAEQLSLQIADQSPISLAGAWAYKESAALSKTAPFPVQWQNNPHQPTVLYNGMIAPVLPYSIKGAIWYQGESNAGKAYQYRTLLPTMIRDWRSRWDVGAFPFYIVQLANFMESKPQPDEDAWAELREAQSITSRNLPNTGIAVIIDIGEAADIHPRNKQDVGKRLALAALAQTYGRKIEYSGPLYRSMKREGKAIRLFFDHAGGGLVARGGKLTGFAIAGQDRRFVWADAEIQGNTILISSPQVARPAAARYAWAANPVCNLYSQAGLPASPFRTDTWPGITANNK
ncbi:MAG: beta galactosidase jelly roll domain-containing protein [Armatimonadetes bacterium]|nr:beta galactosidase jelly roll domain-containing protein [Armatimonadota bacterium]